MIEQQIRHLCKLHTGMTADEVERVIAVAETIGRSAEDHDVFIDVLSKCENEAMVVYHYRPEDEKSVYERSVAGEKALRENEPGVLRTLETGIVSRGLLAKTQENQPVRQIVYPVEYNDQVVCVVIHEARFNEEIRSYFEDDQTDGQVNELVFNRKAMLRLKNEVINHLDDAILLFDHNGYATLKNSKADSYYRRLGYREDIQGLHYDNLSLDRLTFSEIMASGNECTHLPRETFAGGRYYVIKRFNVSECGEFGLVIVLQDITEFKLQEAKIISQSVAMREIHHRVKNNLQTVASLLRIQGRQTGCMETKRNLNENVNRVLAIAAIHELLSMEMRAHVKLFEVIEIVCTNIQRCFANSDNIQVDMEENQPVYLDSDRAVAVALVVNELMLNCYKYAFEDQDQGKIAINLILEDGYAKLTVSDDGKGFAVHEVSQNSLGLSIVRSYVKDKLKGRLEIKSDSCGTTVTFTFKL
jgi:two-component sensor histidine kinase